MLRIFKNTNLSVQILLSEVCLVFPSFAHLELFDVWTNEFFQFYYLLFIALISFHGVIQAVCLFNSVH